MKIISFIFLSFIFLISQAMAYVPDEAYTFDFNIKTSRMNSLKEEKLFEATEVLRQVFSSPEFKERLLKHQFKGRKRFHYNRGLSNYRIYKRILDGMEKLYPYKNNAMDVVVELYTDNNSIVIGYTNPQTRKIWMNTKYFNRHSVAELAGHLTHEWLHKLGFDHEHKKTKYRNYSVPYAVGKIVEELAEEFDENHY